MNGKLFLMGDEFHGLTVAVTCPPLVAHIPAAHFSRNPANAKEQFSNFFGRLVAAIEHDGDPDKEQLNGGLFEFLDSLQKQILGVDDPKTSKEGPACAPPLVKSETVSDLIASGSQVSNVGNCLVFEMTKPLGILRGRRVEAEQPVELRIYLNNMK